MVLIALDGVSVQYAAAAAPLAGITVTFAGGSCAVVGPSGSGKSTLLRVIAGNQTPTAGTVTIDGVPVRRATWATPSDARVAMVFQDYRLVSFLTVRENLLLAAELRGVPCEADAVEQALRRVALEPDLADRMPSSLSGGQQQRVSIARALLAGASVILADEPTGALDADNTRRVADVLAQLGDQGDVAVVVATHDHSVAGRMQRCLSLEGGVLEAVGG